MACLEVADLFGKSTACDLVGLMKRASLRDDQGNNYVIVTPPGSRRFPIMVVYFKDDHAVVTYVQDEESGMQILTSDSSVCKEDEMQFLSPAEDYDSYTGDFIVSASTAVKFLEAFAMGMPWPSLPFWEQL